MGILVTGGAGYIGSATVELLEEKGEAVVVLDNLAHGHESAVHPDVPFYKGDVGDDQLVKKLLEENDIDACVHFAAFAYVGESVIEPSKYFENNTFQTNKLLATLLRFDIKHFVFSSTCATYGKPIRVPIDEDHPQKPVNPYGWSKFMTERILEAYSEAYGFKSVALRYFNAAGATEKCGEHHDPETHLIPNVLNVASGQLPHVSIYGKDYETPDGTCIRDYIHISDLANAHYLALDYLRAGGETTHINLGNGKGFSVLEVVDAARRVTGKQIETKFEGRRPGDPDRLVADSTKAANILGWRPEVTGLEAIIDSAWQWNQNNPRGYLT